MRLNTVQEEQENKINILQQDLLKLQEQVKFDKKKRTFNGNLISSLCKCIRARL